MKYFDSDIDIELEDFVRLDSDMNGTIVSIIDEGKYLDSYLKYEWDYLNFGILILTKEAGLLYYPKVNNKIRFIYRQDLK